MCLTGQKVVLEHKVRLQQISKLIIEIGNTRLE